MTSAVDISNMALAELGARATITALNDPTAAAQQCNLWYDRCRRQLLRAAPWGFARAQYSMTALGNLLDLTSPYPWPWKYAYPSDALRLHYVLPPNPLALTNDQPNVGDGIPWCAPSRQNRYIVANDRDDSNNMRKVVLTNLEFAVGVYTIDVTDPNIFDEAFIQAVASMMAYRMCLALTGNVGMRSQFQASVQDAVTSARAADGNEAIPSTDYTPDWIAVRGAVDSWATPWGGLGSWFTGYDNICWGM